MAGTAKSLKIELSPGAFPSIAESVQGGPFFFCVTLVPYQWMGVSQQSCALWWVNSNILSGTCQPLSFYAFFLEVFTPLQGFFFVKGTHRLSFHPTRRMGATLCRVIRFFFHNQSGMPQPSVQKQQKSHLLLSFKVMLCQLRSSETQVREEANSLPAANFAVFPVMSEQYNILFQDVLSWVRQA